ncbi:hypothetical protein L202_07173 [Cryptococcus amylolentus CBS 6039]|uniref:BTB domain-containing protein n=2 Tax=Cryptococcus amylolentus TaxID=104669 RepID=A0A1E3HEV2_9TREE|nr:hypothetical protein L202_07173 [Cryptococcus amylolentus CBS 6039]ODN74870.1 hypothetical protein L202_07173 [Cryptococcus amylolentus CBS 6039]ODO01766.1 hypothetical protein I350_06595 [Cryptococcus amylolentus CBS 6273]
MSEQQFKPDASAASAKKGEVMRSTLWPKKEDDNGDVVSKIVSADNVEFYVPDLILKTHSEVLHTMINDFGAPAAENQEGCHLLEFSDPKIESSNILHIFLAAGGPGDTLLSVMRFTEKWDCQMAGQNLTKGLLELARQGRDQNVITPIDIFVAAAQLNLPDIAAKVIEVYTITYYVSEVTVTWPVLSSRAEFSIENLEPKAWEMIPGIYMRALYRASTASYPSLRYSSSVNPSYCATTSSQKAAKFLKEVLAPS